MQLVNTRAAAAAGLGGGEEGRELEIMDWVMRAAVVRRGRRRWLGLGWVRRFWRVEGGGVSNWREVLMFSVRSDEGEDAVIEPSRKVDGLHGSVREAVLLSKKSMSE